MAEDGGASPVVSLSAGEMRAVVDRATGRYLADRRAKIGAFAEANFGLLGSLRLHRRAFGLDMLRAPANVALMVPYLGTRLGAAASRAAGAERAARWLGSRRLFFDTDVAREVEWRLHVDLLELPYDDGRGRRSDKDALAGAILADPELAAVLETLAAEILRHRDDPEARARLRGLIGTYAGSRNAAAEIVTNLAFAGAGAAAFSQLTPSALSLGPTLAAAIAQQAAVASFPLGAGLGGLWYGTFGSAAPSAGLVTGMTGGLMLLAAAGAAFAGVVADPIQQALGLHQKRLSKLIDALETELRGDTAAAYEVRDHYVARVFDLIDVLRAAYRAVT